MSGAIITTANSSPSKRPQNARGRQHVLDARGKRDQQIVAGAMAERVVDVLEAVEIEERQRHHLAMRAARQRAVDQLDHLAMVGQAGEHVLVGELPGQPLARAQIAHRAPHLPERDAGKADQEHAGQRQQRPKLARAHCSSSGPAPRRTSR